MVVILAPIESAHMTSYWSSRLNSNIGPILPRFSDIRAFVRRKTLLRYTSLFRPKFQGVPLGVSPWRWGLQRANTPR